MFFEEHLEALRRDRFSVPALVRYGREVAARVRADWDANPTAVRSVWSLALLFFAADFVVSAGFALALLPLASEVGQIGFFLPMRLEQDAIDVVDVDGLVGAADGLDHAADAEIAILAQDAIGGTNNEIDGGPSRPSRAMVTGMGRSLRMRRSRSAEIMAFPIGEVSEVGEVGFLLPVGLQ